MITIITNLFFGVVALNFILQFKVTTLLLSDHDHHEMKEWLFTNESIEKD